MLGAPPSTSRVKIFKKNFEFFFIFTKGAWATSEKHTEKFGKELSDGEKCVPGG